MKLVLLFVSLLSSAIATAQPIQSISTEPLELVAFYAEDLDTGVELHWVGNFDKPTARYDVERSASGRTFVAAGTVSCNALPGRPLAYSFHDNTPFAGLNHYRLVRYAQDGTIAATVPIIVVHKAAFDLRVWPSPSVLGGEVNLTYNGEEEHEFQLELVNVHGERLKRYSIDSDAGQNQLTISADVPRPGRYFLHVFIDDYPVQAYVLLVKN